jgi:hypothetical protein
MHFAIKWLSLQFFYGNFENLRHVEAFTQARLAFFGPLTEPENLQKKFFRRDDCFRPSLSPVGVDEDMTAVSSLNISMGIINFREGTDA